MSLVGQQDYEFFLPPAIASESILSLQLIGRVNIYLCIAKNDPVVA